MKPATLLAIGVGVTLTMLPFPGEAASRWNTSLDDSLDVSLTFVDRSGSDETSGPVMQVSPGFSLDRRGARASADIDYKLNVAVGGDDTETLTHNLTARGDLEAVEDLLYIDATAGARFVGDSATSGSVDAIGGEADGSQSYSLKISPSLRPRTDNRYVSFVSNNSLDLVDYTGGSDTSGDGSTSATWNLGLVSGPIFTTFNWDAGVTQTTTRFDDRDDTRTDYSAGIGYRVNAQWRLNARAGYEENDVQTTRGDTDGVIWNVGGIWTPNPRTSVALDYGDRYFGDAFTARVSHRTRRTTLSLDASRDVTNRRDSRLVDSFFSLVDQNGNVITDPNTGNPVVINVPQLEETDEDFLNTQIRGAISVIGRRTSVSLTGTAANRQFENSNSEEDAYGVSLSISRQLGQGISSSLTTRYDRAEDTANGDSDSYDVGLRLSKSLSSKTSVSLDLLHRERDGTNSADDFTENRVGISVSSSFL